MRHTLYLNVRHPSILAFRVCELNQSCDPSLKHCHNSDNHSNDDEFAESGPNVRAVTHCGNSGQHKAERKEELILRLRTAVLSIVVGAHVLIDILNVLDKASVENYIGHDRAVNSKSFLLNISVQVPSVSFDYEKSIVIEHYKELKLAMRPSFIYGQV